MNDDPVSGLDEFSAESVMDDLAAAFTGATRHDSPGTTFLELDEDPGLLEIWWSPQHLVVECRRM